MGEKMILLEKAERGVEEPTRITVRIKESTFQREFSDFDNSALHTYEVSQSLSKPPEVSQSLLKSLKASQSLLKSLKAS